MGGTASGLKNMLVAVELNNCCYENRFQEAKRLLRRPDVREFINYKVSVLFFKH